VGRLADSRSRRNLLLAGVALWSTMTIMCGAADTYWELFLARMGVGVGEACLVPCAYSLITDYFPRERRSLPLTIFSGGIMLGAGVANVCGGMVAQYAQNGGPREIFLFGLVQPWQLAFILVGLPGIFFVATIATIREPARHERKGKPDSGVMFRYLFRHGATFTSLILGTTFGAMANMAMLGWAPVWFERRFGWNKAEIGTYLGIFIFIFGTIGLTLSGSLANRFIRAGRKLVYIRLMMAAEGLVIIPLVLAHVVDNPYWVLGCIGGTIFFTGIPSGLGPAALQEITPNEMRGQITAIAFLILALVATTVGGTLVGLLTDYVFIDPKAVRSSAVVVAVFASIMGIISLRLGLRAYERTAEENRASNK
jgi:MFS family permease